MSGAGTQDEEVRKFYDRWSAAVFTFCHFYVGDESLAADATAEAFSAYIRHGLTLERNRMPLGLLRFALEVVQACEVVITDDVESTDFADWVLALPSEERAVFLLHGVLGVQFPWITAVTGGSYEQICQAWIRSLVRMQSHLPSFRSVSGGAMRLSNSRYASYAPTITGLSQC